MKENENLFVLIDGNSLINRAYYAIQRPMIASDGTHTQGIYGFLSMLEKLRREYSPTHMMVAFDLKGPTFRHEKFEDYKAGRKKTPEELAEQIPILKDILTAMGIKICEAEGFEADDIIGTMSSKAAKEDLPVLIFTGDKDELQLIEEGVRVVITKKGISEFALYDEEYFFEEYGFEPDKLIDYKGLRGDPSDNIPGIPGVGDKTAKQLVQQFGTVENLLASLDEIPGEKLRKKIEENSAIAVLSKRLATIVTTVPVEMDAGDCVIGSPDEERLIEIYKRLQFRTHLRNLMERQASEPSGEGEDGAKTEENSDIEAGMPPFVSVSSSAEAERVLSEIANASSPLIAEVESDLAHSSMPTLTGFNAISGDTCYIISGVKDLPAIIRKAFSGKKIRFIGYDLQKTYYVLMRHGVDTSGFSTDFDPAIAEYVISPAGSGAGLEALIYSNFQVNLAAGIEEPKQLHLFEEPVAVNGKDTALRLHCIGKLKEIQAKKIEEEDLSYVFYNIELPLCKVLASMEAEGMRADRDELAAFGTGLAVEINSLEAEIHELAGENFNVNSPSQLSVVLFENLKLPGGKKTSRGYSTSAEVLERLRPLHPIVDKVLEYRTLAKLKGTYVDGIIPLIGEDGMVRAHFQQRVTSTGRISCTEPNLQNIPIRQEVGRQLRRAFTARNEDYILVGADYSQIELRVLAHMSEDPSLIEAFNEDADIHSMTASKVFNIPGDEVTEELRSKAKAVNFGIIYGMSAFGLSNEISVSMQEAESYIEEYFKEYAAVREFIEGSVKFAKENGFVRTLFGRKRAIPEMNASAYMVRQIGERLAKNTPIQGTAADIIKLAMIKVSERLYKECPRSKLILQIHDELIIDAHREELSDVRRLLASSMEGAAKLKVRLDISINEGENWYMLK